MEDVKVAGLPVGRSFLRLRLFRSALRMGRATHQGGQGIRRRFKRGRNPPIPRHLNRTRQRQPVSQPFGRRNLALFERMRAGEFPDGSRTLRAKIDMASPNFNFRDPVMYRILMPITIAPEANGAFIPCMILLTGSRIRLSGLRIPCVRLSLRTIARFIVGS